MLKLFLIVLVLKFVIHSHCKWSKEDFNRYGPLQLAIKSNLIKCDHDRSLNLDVADIDVYFHDFHYKIVEKYNKYTAYNGILKYSNLNKNNKFIFYVGDIRSHIHGKLDQRVRDAFKNVPDSYFIFIDHSSYTNDKIGPVKSYERAVRYVHYIGKGIADILTGLSLARISSKNMHAIGHGIGAQILAHAGDAFIESTREQIGRITALDPAGPCFSNTVKQNQIRSGVADFVEVYHCNDGGLGTTSTYGDVDFFVNERGKSQPNCKIYPVTPFNKPKAAKCNHRSCVDIWIATISNKDWYLAWKCRSYDMFIAGDCKGNHVTNAGYWIPQKVYGVYYLSTDGYKVPFTKILKKPQRR